MSIHYRQQGSAIVIFGNTYPVKDRIKALGGRFNGADKNWRIPLSDDNLALIDALCTSSGGGNLGPSPLTTSVQAPAAAINGAQNEEPALLVDGLSVRQLMDRVGSAISSIFPELVWVVGEVQNLSQRASGLFFELAEGRDHSHQNATVTVKAIIWQRELALLKERRGHDLIKDILADGMQLRCLCRVGFYKDRGQISLTVEDIDPSFTRGALALAREKLLRELRSKGLDDANKKTLLTPFPFRIGLISAAGSRAQSDFMDQLLSGGFPGEVLFCPAPMQGEAVPNKVCEALVKLIEARCDLIVITRGGGSAADLRWFDAPEIAYAIADCSTPIVCAIGHHDDVSVAEEVSYLRQKTPTAAADFVLSIFATTRERIDWLAASLAQALSRRLDEVNALQSALSERLAAAGLRALATRAERLTRLSHGLLQRMTVHFGSAQQKLTHLSAELKSAAMHSLNIRREKLGELERHIIRRDPTPWLEQGWTQLFLGNKLVKSVASIQTGEIVHARLADGTLQLTVNHKELKEKQD